MTERPRRLSRLSYPYHCGYARLYFSACKVNRVQVAKTEALSVQAGCETDRRSVKVGSCALLLCPFCGFLLKPQAYFPDGLAPFLRGLMERAGKSLSAVTTYQDRGGNRSSYPSHYLGNKRLQGYAPVPEKTNSVIILHKNGQEATICLTLRLLCL